MTSAPVQPGSASATTPAPAPETTAGQPFPTRYREGEARATKMGTLLKRIAGVESVDEEQMLRIGAALRRRDELGQRLAEAIRTRAGEPGRVSMSDLDTALRAATRVSFDRLDSDGCMSTNDTVTLLASGASGITPSLEDFTAALTQACTDLAMQLLKDAEGADHEIAITTLNAATEDEAVEVSRSVARSNLFKAAVFGNDPNWGRVLASIGTTDATFDPADLDVAINGVWVCKQSTPHADPATVDLKPREVSVTIDLKSGSERATVWTNDLTHAYVHENSAYSS